MQSGLFCGASERDQTVMGLRNGGQHCAGAEIWQMVFIGWVVFCGCFSSWLFFGRRIRGGQVKTYERLRLMELQCELYCLT